MSIHIGIIQKNDIVYVQQQWFCQLYEQIDTSQINKLL